MVGKGFRQIGLDYLPGTIIRHDSFLFCRIKIKGDLIKTQILRVMWYHHLCSRIIKPVSEVDPVARQIVHIAKNPLDFRHADQEFIDPVDRTAAHEFPV